MTATVLLSRPGPLVARLPLAAVLDTGKGPTVWVVDAGGTHLARHAVKIARIDDDSVLVTSGVAEGDRVVVLGVQKLDAATPVRVVTQLGF